MNWLSYRTMLLYRAINIKCFINHREPALVALKLCSPPNCIHNALPREQPIYIGLKALNILYILEISRGSGALL